MLGEKRVSFEKTKENTTPKFWRNLGNITNFEVFVSFRPEAQNIKKKSVLDSNQTVLTIMECFDKFAPERVCNDKAYGTEWITNIIQNAILECNKTLQRWIDNPSDGNRSAHKLARNSATSKIRNAKRDPSFEKRSDNPSTRTISGHLKDQ